MTYIKTKTLNILEKSILNKLNVGCGTVRKFKYFIWLIQYL